MTTSGSGSAWGGPPSAEVIAPEQTAEAAALHDDDFERLRELTRASRRSIKTLLMDQRVIGGIGNICASEILYQAGIAPGTPAADLTDAQVREIARITPEFLEWAIDTQSRRDLLYLGEKGAENVFSIYRRAGEACPRCGTPILRTLVGGRGTCHCPTCQP